MARRFYLYKRGGVYYAKLINPETGTPMNARSTGTTDKEEALFVIAGWLKEGLPSDSKGGCRDVRSVFALGAILEAIGKDTTLDEAGAAKIVEALHKRGLVDAVIPRSGPGSELFIDFLRRFWNYEESPYIREKLAHGQRIGHKHAIESLGRINYYWAKFFNGKKLCEVRKTDLKAFSVALAERGLAHGTINRVLMAGTTALHWAYENELIPQDVTIGLLKFAGDAKKRGILEQEEAEKLFRLAWSDERSYWGNMLAMTTGLRAGEILAIRRCDIGDDRIMVRHSWNSVEGLKCTKNGEERKVYLLPALRDALLALASKNPHRLGDEAFVFYSTLPDKPMDGKMLLCSLQDALVQLKVGNSKDKEALLTAKQYWRSRNIVFHSWRHFYSTFMDNHNVEERKIMLATGHKTKSVFESYADHGCEEDFLDVADVSAKIFDFIPGIAEGHCQKPGMGIAV